MRAKSDSAGLAHRRFTALWELSRPRTCLVGVLSFATAVGLVGVDWGPQQFAWALVSFLIPVAANLHNSYTDLEEDARNLPGRLKLVDQAGVTTLRVAVYVLLAAIVVISAVVHLWAMILGTTGVLLLLSYSAPPIRAKARPLLGLVVFTFVVVFPFAAGSLITDTWMEPAPFLRNGAPWFGLFLFVAFLAKGMIKNVPDYEGDKAAGLRTSATILPSLRTAGRLAGIATIVVYALYPVVVLLSGAPVWMYIPSVWFLPVAWSALKFMRLDEAKSLNRALKWDMAITVGFLATMALSASLSIGTVVVTLLSIVLLFVTDLIGADSRADRHMAVSTRVEELVDDEV